MSEQENFDALFNPTVEMGDKGGKVYDDYQVGADKGKNGVYQSIIRFIPWHKNPKNSIQEKWVSWLVDPITQKGRFVDCPSSIGKPSLLSDMYWKLKKSESVQEQKKAEIFSRRHNFAALIQVIKDEQQPELEGKIMVYRFGKKIWDKINSELKPILGEPHNPFNLLNGKAFALVITKVSGFNNYDQAKFVDKVIPLCLTVKNDKDDKEDKLIPITPATDKGMVFKYLQENSPDLEKYGYKEWDADTYDYVNGVVTAVTGQVIPSNTMSDVNNVAKQNNPIPAQPNSNQGIDSGISSTDISLSDLDTTISNDMPNIDLPDIPVVGGLTGDLDDLLVDL